MTMICSYQACSSSSSLSSALSCSIFRPMLRCSLPCSSSGNLSSRPCHLVNTSDTAARATSADSLKYTCREGISHGGRSGISYGSTIREILVVAVQGGEIDHGSTGGRDQSWQCKGGGTNSSTRGWQYALHKKLQACKGMRPGITRMKAPQIAD